MSSDPSSRKTRSYQSTPAGKEEKKKKDKEIKLRNQFSEEFNAHLAAISGKRIGGRAANNLIRCLNALARECLEDGVTCSALGYDGTNIYVAGNNNSESTKIKEKLE